jgi:hypothetical protein
MVGVLALAASAAAQGQGQGQGPASSQPSPAAGDDVDNLDQAARALFTEGRDAFDAGDFERAATMWRRAYDLSPRPVLLLNVAAALDKMRLDHETLEVLRLYLEVAGEADNRAQIERRIAYLEQAIAEHDEREAAANASQAPEDSTPTPAASAPPPASSVDDEEEDGGLPPIVLIAVGGAAVIAGGLVVWSGLDTVGANDDYEERATAPGATVAETQPLLDDATGAETRTNVLIGVAGALGLAAVAVAIFTDFSPEERGDPAALSVGPDHVLITSSHRF